MLIPLPPSRPSLNVALQALAACSALARYQRHYFNGSAVTQQAKFTFVPGETTQQVFGSLRAETGIYLRALFSRFSEPTLLADQARHAYVKVEEALASRRASAKVLLQSRSCCAKCSRPELANPTIPTSLFDLLRHVKIVVHRGSYRSYGNTSIWIKFSDLQIQPTAAI